MLQRPRQQAFAEFGDLQAVAQHDRVAPDKVDTADVRVEVDADTRPVEARGDLLDMGRLTGAVIALHHHAAIMGKAREDRQRGIRVEHVVRIGIGHALVSLGKGRNLHVDIDPEGLAHVEFDVGGGHHCAVGLVSLGDFVHLVALPSGATWLPQHAIAVHALRRRSYPAWRAPLSADAKPAEAA